MLPLFLYSMHPLFLSESALQCRVIDIQPLLFMSSPSHVLFSQDIRCETIEGECGCILHEHCLTDWLLIRDCCPEHADRQWVTTGD